MNMELAAAQILERELESFYLAHPECENPFLMAQLEQALASCTDMEFVDVTTCALFTEMMMPRLGFNRDDGRSKKYYDCVCEQIYRLMTSEAYHEERLTASTVKNLIIPTVSVYIAQQTKWDAVLISALIALVMNTVCKVGIRAWCTYYEGEHPELKR